VAPEFSTVIVCWSFEILCKLIRYCRCARGSLASRGWILGFYGGRSSDEGSGNVSHAVVSESSIVVKLAIGCAL
jgi:hypothetical protein